MREPHDGHVRAFLTRAPRSASRVFIVDVWVQRGTPDHVREECFAPLGSEAANRSCIGCSRERLQQDVRPARRFPIHIRTEERPFRRRPLDGVS